jgi:hypothetical protein
MAVTYDPSPNFQKRSYCNSMSEIYEYLNMFKEIPKQNKTLLLQFGAAAPHDKLGALGGATFCPPTKHSRY